MSEHGANPADGELAAQADPAAVNAPAAEATSALPVRAADEHHVDAHDPDGHGHGSALGPIDWRAYGAGTIGAALGLVVAAVLAVSTGYIVL
jgi:hypothetical protein